MKKVVILMIAFFLASCFIDIMPPRKHRIVKFNYQNIDEWYSFLTDTASFVHYSERIKFCAGLTRENDSVFSTSITTENESIYALIKVILKEQDEICKIKLLSVDSISYLDNYPEEERLAMKMSYNSCFQDFKKKFIEYRIKPINNCINQDSFYLQGLENFSKNKLELSFHCFDSASKIETGSELLFYYEQYSALNRIAYIKILQFDFVNALKYIDLAFSIEPQYLNYSNRQRWIRNEHLDEKYIDELKSYYKYNDIRTHQLLIHANKAYVLYRLNRIKEAKKNLKIAEELYGNEKVVTILKGIDLYFDGDYQKSVSILSKLDKADLDMLDYQYYLDSAKKKIREHAANT